MENLYVYNKCKTELLLGIQLEKKRSEYKLGYNLEATIDMGTEREKQEDAVIILEHPKDKDTKLIAVADGVGSEGNSQMASKYTLEELACTFECDKNIIKKDSFYITRTLIETIEKINQKVKTSDIGKTTLSLALYNPKETIIINIGDSRIYTQKDKELIQRTRDDSVVQNCKDEGIIKDKDLMRFHKLSNLITNAVGSDNFCPNYKIIQSDYDILLALTDGVTDCLSDKEINYIVNKYKKYNLSSYLVDFALNNISYNDKEKSKDYYRKILGGKDNTTAAVLKLK